MAELKENNNIRNVSELIPIFGQPHRTLSKPTIPRKPAKYINGRIVWLKQEDRPKVEMNDNDSGSVDINSSNNSIKGRSDTDSDVDVESVSQLDSITNECIAFINVVLKSLTYLMEFKLMLADKFQDNKEVSIYLASVFRDIQPLHMLYQMVLDKINVLKSKGSLCLTDLFLDNEVRGPLNIYKAFFSQYSLNAKWIGEFYRSNADCQEVCRLAKEKMKADDLVTLDSCLYTIFSSLFSFELIINRYGKCFEEGHESRQKAEEVKNLISNLLIIINTTVDQENFLLTHKELNLITGRSRETKITTRFIQKGTVMKMSRRDEKTLTRQLVLFSDCLYVTLPPGNLSGTSSVRQELSLDTMTVSRITNEEVSGSNFKWGLHILAREAHQDFFFEDEATMNLWMTKLQSSAGSDFSSLNEQTKEMTMPRIGVEAPRWQKDSAAGYCNGFKCNQKFSSTVRRHHCRADGLLYCDACCYLKVKLNFERSAESRVCDLCFRILLGDLHRPKELETAKKNLETVFEKKSHKGKIKGLLESRDFNRDKNAFHPVVKYFCELDKNDPFLNLYEKHEDKIKHHGIMLLGMVIRIKKESRYCKRLKPVQFIIEHQDKAEAYLFDTPSPEICAEWVKCLRESISTYCDS